MIAQSGHLRSNQISRLQSYLGYGDLKKQFLPWLKFLIIGWDCKSITLLSGRSFQDELPENVNDYWEKLYGELVDLEGMLKEIEYGDCRMEH